MVENTNAGCDVGRWHFDARRAADKLRRRRALVMLMLLSQSAHWIERLLRVGGAFRWSLLAVSLIKSIHASGGVN